MYLCMHVRVRLQVRAGVHAGVRASAYIWMYDYYIIFLYMRRSVCVGCGCAYVYVCEHSNVYVSLRAGECAYA